jgi:hypothetical protein
MWLFTQTGFFSVVQDYNDKAKLHIRSRFREDLERLRARYIPKLAIKHTPRADYAYRAEISRRDYVLLAGALAAAVDYPNFKDRVTDEQGHDRHMLYMDVWTTMLRAQREAELERRHGVQRLRGHIPGWTGVFPGDEEKQAELDASRPRTLDIEAIETPEGLFGHFAVIRCGGCGQPQGTRHLEGCSHAGELEQPLIQGAMVPPGAYARSRDAKRVKKKAAKKNAKARKRSRH